MAELRAMFDDMADRAAAVYDDERRRYQATDKVSLDKALLSIATMCSALVELVDVIRFQQSAIELLQAHSENLIERVYELEGGDEREVHPGGPAAD